MQKDVHFYLTYYLARKAGISENEAQIIAWSCQHVDDMTSAELYGLQTQSNKFDDWRDPQIQATVIVPFHFVPGGRVEDGWLVRRGGEFIQDLCDSARRSGSPYSQGIALHALQDSYSHEGFTGWREDVNSCFPWYYIRSAIPNVGHAEMGVTPDIATAVWTDPRDGQVVNNKDKVMGVAAAAYEWLRRFHAAGSPAFTTVRQDVIDWLGVMKYDARKRRMREMAGAPGLRYSDLDQNGGAFVQAARTHLGEAMNLFWDLKVPNG